MSLHQDCRLAPALEPRGTNPVTSSPSRRSELVSVVIPVRDEGRKIATTIRSVAAARTGRTEVEFVVADDASSDGCTDHLDAVVQRIPRSRLVLIRSEERLGVPRARNLAMRHATGEVMF